MNARLSLVVVAFWHGEAQPGKTPAIRSSRRRAPAAAARHARAGENCSRLSARRERRCATAPPMIVTTARGRIWRGDVRADYSPAADWRYDEPRSGGCGEASVNIAAWLLGLGLQQYETAFRDNAI